ncbi:MAG TPA: hypothetical protein PLJ56_05925, partial [Rectinema sp.]|nr:hypothetical protein [Rectinema sp.]
DKGNPVEDSKFPLEERVAIHLATIEAILDAWNYDSLPDKHIEFSMFPNWQDIKEHGIGKILNW